jgi:hypothetical protein
MLVILMHRRPSKIRRFSFDRREISFWDRPVILFPTPPVLPQLLCHEGGIAFATLQI